MQFLKGIFVLIGLAIFGMTGAATANEALVTLDVEVSLQEAPSSPSDSHPRQLFSGTFAKETALGREVKLVHEYEEGRSFVLALTPTLTNDSKVALAFVLTDKWDTGARRLDANLVVLFGQTAVFHTNNFDDHRRTWHISVTPRR